MLWRYPTNVTFVAIGYNFVCFSFGMKTYASVPNTCSLLMSGFIPFQISKGVFCKYRLSPVPIVQSRFNDHTSRHLDQRTILALSDSVLLWNICCRELLLYALLSLIPYRLSAAELSSLVRPDYFRWFSELCFNTTRNLG